MTRAQHGDHDAYAQLIEPRGDHLYRIAHAMLGDRARAEDAVQDACIEAWRDLPRLRAPDRFDAWLRRILVRTCLDAVRRRPRIGTEVRVDADGEPAWADHAASVIEADAIARAFARLSPRHRAVVVLSHLEGLSTAEIGRSLGLPTGTVKSRLHYALRAMRAELEADARTPRRTGEIA